MKPVGARGEMGREVTWDQFSPDKGTEQSSGDKLDSAGPCFNVGDTASVEWVGGFTEDMWKPGWPSCPGLLDSLSVYGHHYWPAQLRWKPADSDLIARLTRCSLWWSVCHRLQSEGRNSAAPPLAAILSQRWPLLETERQPTENRDIALTIWSVTAAVQCNDAGQLWSPQRGEPE